MLVADRHPLIPPSIQVLRIFSFPIQALLPSLLSPHCSSPLFSSPGTITLFPLIISYPDTIIVPHHCPLIQALLPFLYDSLIGALMLPY
jgi:hypothetical protein